MLVVDYNFIFYSRIARLIFKLKYSKISKKFFDFNKELFKCKSRVKAKESEAKNFVLI